MKRKFSVTVSAMILAVHLGSPVAAAEPSVEELNEIAAYLATNDVEALRAYILLRPELLEGDTPLAALLREFMEESVNVAEYLGFEPDLRDAIARGRDTSDSDACSPLDACPPEPVLGVPPAPDVPPDVQPEPEAPPVAPTPPVTRNPPALGQAPEPVDTIY